jgi:chemotaxis protein MotB
MSSHNKYSAPKVEDGEGWLVSYADMMTLLFGFFVIIYSMSQVDDKKFQSMGKQLAEAFGGEKQNKNVSLHEGISMETREARAFQLLSSILNLGESENAVEKVESAASNEKNMGAAKEIWSKELKGTLTEESNIFPKSSLEKNAHVEMVLPETILFAPGNDLLTMKAESIIKKISQSLQKIEDLVGIEVVGHTDSTPPAANSKFRTNFALSSARAGAVAQALIDNGLDPTAVSVRGMGGLRPLFPETGVTGQTLEENRNKNRRVSIVLVRRAAN